MLQLFGYNCLWWLSTENNISIFYGIFRDLESPRRHEKRLHWSRCRQKHYFVQKVGKIALLVLTYHDGNRNTKVFPGINRYVCENYCYTTSILGFILKIIVLCISPAARSRLHSDDFDSQILPAIYCNEFLPWYI